MLGIPTLVTLLDMTHISLMKKNLPNSQTSSQLHSVLKTIPSQLPLIETEAWVVLSIVHVTRSNASGSYHRTHILRSKFIMIEVWCRADRSLTLWTVERKRIKINISINHALCPATSCCFKGTLREEMKKSALVIASKTGSPVSSRRASA